MSKHSIDLTVPGHNSKAFAERLTLLFEERGTVPRLHKELGIAQTTLWKWAKGKTEPSRDYLIALSEALNVNFLWLALGEGPMRGGTPERNSVMHSSGVLSQEAIESVKKSVEYAERIIDAHEMELDAAYRSRLVMIIFEMLVGKTDEEIENEIDRVENVVKLFG